MYYEIYKDKAGEWRWRLKARNGRIVANSGEGYKRKSSALKMIMKIKVAAWGLPIQEED